MDRKQEINSSGQAASWKTHARGYGRSLFCSTSMAVVATMAVCAVAMLQTAEAAPAKTKFRRISTQFIAALGDPGATSGSNAQLWGLWRLDPGPRGVRLDRYERLQASGGVAPAKWQFDEADWWLEEHGLIMEAPVFSVAPGKYLVTGDRAVRTTLTIHAMQADGTQRWQLAGGATLNDVTHLACRSARYTPATGSDSCSPVEAPRPAFPVRPGAAMPAVDGCNKQDYAVLLVIGVAEESG